MVNNFGRRDSNVDEGSVSLGVGVAAGVVDEGMLRFLEGGNRRLRQSRGRSTTLLHPTTTHGQPSWNPLAEYVVYVTASILLVCAAGYKFRFKN